MKKLFTLLLFLSVFFTLNINLSVASMYPPDYVFGTDCKITGPVKVCRIQTLSGWNLRIIYFGYLMETTYLPINIFVKINGKEGDFVLNKDKFAQYIEIGTSKRNCKYNNYNNSENGSSIPNAEGMWTCQLPGHDEQNLFFWAINQYGGVNDWDVEIAFYQAGRWDSNLGKNFTFNFKQ